MQALDISDEFALGLRIIWPIFELPSRMPSKQAWHDASKEYFGAEMVSPYHSDAECMARYLAETCRCMAKEAA